MTDKELQKLKRSELLEIMLGLQNELDDQREENKILQAKLDKKTIAIDNAGSIAEAALEINNVLNDAQKAADTYLENIRKMHNEQESRYNEIVKNATDEAEKLYATAKSETEKLRSSTNVECQIKIKETDEACNKKIKETDDICIRKSTETDEACNKKINETEKMCSEKSSETERMCSEKIKQIDEECNRRINETNVLCTKKIKETQEKCTAISSLDNKIATFFKEGSPNDSNDIKAES